MHGNYYGTNLDQVTRIRDVDKKVCLLDIDVKGANDIWKSGLLDCNYLFVKTPSLAELERRLLSRKTETPQSLARRLKNAEAELRFAEESGIFQKTFVNDVAQRFIEETELYIVSELYKIKE